MWQYLTRRSVFGVVLLTLVFNVFYLWFWYVNTKAELNRAGARIPTAWLLLVPFANVWWVWEWANGVAYATRMREQPVALCVLMLLLPWVGAGVVQAALNRAIDESEPIRLPEARIVGTDTTFTTFCRKL